jgi:hypothetical protein
MSLTGAEPVFHEILSPEETAETTAWWRQAFLALDEAVPDAAEGEDPNPGSPLRGSPDTEQRPQDEAGRRFTPQGREKW